MFETLDPLQHDGQLEADFYEVVADVPDPAFEQPFGVRENYFVEIPLEVNNGPAGSITGTPTDGNDRDSDRVD